MGTNYYLRRNICPHCGRYDHDDELHIGKSSGGWCFSLHVIPELGLNSLEDWEREWAKEEWTIFDECGDKITPREMRDWITKREWGERGAAGLRRHDIGRHCVGHGPGTWDLIPGTFC